MCKSQAEGGQRCASHTRGPYENTPMDDATWDQKAAEYASTAEGRARILTQAEAADTQGDFETAARLFGAVSKGADMRAANRAAAEAIRQADMSTWTPAEVDDKLADLYYERAKATAKRDSLRQYVAKEVSRRNGRFSTDWNRLATPEQVDATITELQAQEAHGDRIHPNDRSLLRQWTDANAYQTTVDDLTAQMRPYEREYERRGRWTRAFLATSSGDGHVHKSMNCSTCRPTTQFHWVTEYSGKNEAEIVEAAGERACTVCHPTAPTEALSRPTSIYSPEERAQQASREERATAAQARQATKIAKALTPDGSEFKVEYTSYGRRSREYFKTETAATQWMVKEICRRRSPGSMTEPMHETQVAENNRIIEAIMTKHGKTRAEVEADIEKKVKAKLKRDYGVE